MAALNVFCGKSLVSWSYSSYLIFEAYDSDTRGDSELPRVAAVMLAWEGAILAGAFLGAIGLVAAGGYMLERSEQRTRTECALTPLLVPPRPHAPQSSLAYYRRHSELVARQLAASSAATEACRRRAAARRADLEAELAGWRSHREGAKGGDWRGWAGSLPLAGAARDMYVRWRLQRWQRELQLSALAAALTHQASERAALADRLSRWSAYRCRSTLLRASGTLWTSRNGGGGRTGGEGKGGGGDGDGGGDRRQQPERAPGSSTTAAGGHEGNGERGQIGSTEGGASDGAGGGNGGGVEEGTGGERCWCWSLEVHLPAWMSEEDTDLPLQPGGGEDGEEGAGEGEAEGGMAAEVLRELAPLLRDSMPRW
ncbi:hypothetical protein GPECTOR_63g36 [Gonium pectorale]|uniref:Uncharacterized protein n=1 Tax=Gonium pectorale TaxID=33097 RepID=A0A150G492_GONPE|nr:hypothetical protein GPECTOR_63g36 [Gonium pectorale]|eukprot:KXZ44709.1 hypothetical protein GPECTOR_63g36 [Gonium pectorale]